MRIEYISWPLMAIMMIGWAWLQYNGGQLPDDKYLMFCFMMALGQFGGGLECFIKKSWGFFAVNVYFFGFTAWGIANRFGLI